MAEATVTRVIEVDVRASAAAQQHIAQIASSMKSVEESANTTKNALVGFGEQAMSAGKALLSGWVGSKIIEAVMAVNALNDAQKQLTARMTQVTGSTEGASKAFSEIVRISREQGRELDGTGKLYEKISRQQDQLGITTRGVSVLTEGFAASLRLSGAGTQEANAAMLQFSQALASGKLAGDEFRSMTENNSVFMYELSKALGKTQGDLKKMSKDGSLDLATLREAMFKVGEDGLTMLERMMKKASDLPQTFGMAVNGVKAALADYLNALGSAGEQSEGILTRMMKWIGNNLTMSAAQERVKGIFEIERKKALGLDTTADEKKANQTPQDKVLDEVIEKRNAALDKTRDKEKELADLRAKGYNNENFMVKRLVSDLKELESQRIASNRSMELLVKPEEGDHPLLQTGWKPPKTDPKKVKAPKHEKEDSLMSFDTELSKAEAHVEEQLDGMGKWEMKLQDALSNTTYNLYDKGVQQMVARLRSRAQRDDVEDALKDFFAYRMKEYEKDQKALEAKTKADAAAVESANDRLDKILGKSDPIQKMKLANADLIELRDKMGDLVTPELWAKFSEAIQKNKDLMAKELLGLPKETKSIGDQMAENWEGTFSRMTDSMLQFNKTGKQLIGDFVKDFLTQWAKLEMKKAFAPMMASGEGLIKGLITGAEKWFAPSADGNMFVNNVRLMANGGVLGGPTYLGRSADGTHNVGGEAGPEAVMPLQRGNDGKLGIAATPVTVNVINNATGTRATATEQTSPNGQKQITVLVEEVVENGLGSGKFDKVLGHNFGVSRKGKQ